MIECGRRSITDRGTLTHIARTLVIPPRMLGIADPGDADFAAMLAFGISVIRLADIARHSGRAGEAVSELWPLIIRLKARIAAGHAEPEMVSPLAQARVSFGVALGTCCLRSSWPLPLGGPAGRCASPGIWATGGYSRSCCACMATSFAKPDAPGPVSSGSGSPCRSMITPHAWAPGWSFSLVLQPNRGRRTC